MMEHMLEQMKESLAPGVYECLLHTAQQMEMMADLMEADMFIDCLGTDGVTRSLENLLAKCRGLDEEGITAFMWTGFYAVPLKVKGTPQGK